MPVISLSKTVPAALHPLFSDLGRVVVADQNIDTETRIYVGTTLDRIDDAFIRSLPETVELIASGGVGLDHIDFATARERRIAVSNTPVVTEDTADMAWTLLLAACRKLYKNELMIRSGEWTTFHQPDFLGSRVHGKTLGIVGLGAIGEAVARRARGFGMRVLYTGPNEKPEAAARVDAEYCAALSELLNSSDIVSLNCSLNETTRYLINAETLQQMKDGAVLVNVGRGGLVDEAALAQALATGKLKAAGLDVFESEPRINPDLVKMDNVVLSPHIGAATIECFQDVGLCLLNNVKRFIETGEVLNCVAAKSG